MLDVSMLVANFKQERAVVAWRRLLLMMVEDVVGVYRSSSQVDGRQHKWCMVHHVRCKM
jgi:hypothetical protein